MPTYISLLKMTTEGAKNVKSLIQRQRDAVKAAQAAGVKVHGTWMTLGRYDLVSVVEAPDDATMARVALQVGKNGNFSTETLKAFNEAETEKIISSVS
jgi:uncharacterized protein with GYD domain